MLVPLSQRIRPGIRLNAVFCSSSPEVYELLEKDIDDSLSFLMCFRERRKDHLNRASFAELARLPAYVNMKD